MNTITFIVQTEIKVCKALNKELSMSYMRVENSERPKFDKYGLFSYGPCLLISEIMQVQKYYEAF